MSAQKLKQLFSQDKHLECAEFAMQCIDKNPKDKVANLFLAQCQVRLGQLSESQLSLNNVYSLVQRGQGQDDALLFTAYTCQEQLAIKLQEIPSKKATGRQIHLSNKFQMIDFLSYKKRYDKMIEESEMYCLLLLEDGKYREIEDTYKWLMDHKGLTEDVRASYGARIYEIDPFYNPLIRLDNLFGQLIRLAPNSPCLAGLAVKMLEQLDKQSGKKSVQLALQGQDVDQNIRVFKDFCENLKGAGLHAFKSTDQIFKTKFTIKMFMRYLAAVAATTVFLSDDWTKFEARIKQLLSTEYCVKTVGDLEQNPLQIYLNAFLDVAKFAREGRAPNFEELYVSKMPQGNLAEILDSFSKEFQDLTLYVNAYYALVATSNNVPQQLDANATQAKISQSLFLHRKMQYYKFGQQRDVSDLYLFLSCLSLKLPIDKEQSAQNFINTEQAYEKYKNFCSKPILDYYQATTAQLKWQASLHAGSWLQAIDGLDELAKMDATKADFVVVKKAQIQLLHLQELCGDNQQDKDLFVQGAMNSIQACAVVEAENLLVQGFLMWSYPELFQVTDKKPVLNKWLQALKKDQTNPEIYFSLAVYYFNINDTKRASGCLDKVLKLQPDFEPALVLQFYLLTQTDMRLSIVDKFMVTNRNVAVTYFLRGLIMQQSQDYIQAIEMYQNAIKFYTIQKGKPRADKLLPKVELSIHKNPIGIYGEANAAICWVYLSECFMKIEKPQVALKCFTQGAEEISKIKASETTQSEEVEELLQILNLQQFEPNQLMQKSDPLLVILSQVKPSKWALECLMLGSKLVPSAQTSISILKLALKCEPAQGVLAFILTELLNRVTQLIEKGVVFDNGQVQMLDDTKQVIERVDKLCEVVAKRQEFKVVQNLQKKRLDALSRVAMRTQTKQRFSQVLEAAKQLYDNLSLYPGWCSLVLDYAKIIHEFQRFDDSDPHLQDLKVSLIKKAILLDSTQANLWVHLHLFSKNDFEQSKSIFKAYELEPENTFVQETILKHYLKTKQWKKAFKIIVRSYQRATNANQPQLPIILATLAYFNAVCYFQTFQKAQLLEALSLIRLIQREDMKQLLSELYVYLSHYNGDYMTTLQYLQTKEGVDQLLVKAQFGSTTHSYEQVKQKCEVLGLAKGLLKEVFDVETLNDQELKALCESDIKQFGREPTEVAPMLALHQELCLRRGILPKINVLDDPEIRSLLQKLDTNQQRTILMQGLRLLQARDGMIKEAKAIIEEGKDPQQIDAGKSYTVFIIEAARLKPQNLSTAQHKALLRAYLQSKQDPSSLQGLFTEQANLTNVAKVQGLKLILKQKQEAADNGLSQLMRDPLSIEANTKWLWSLLRSGKVKETLDAFKLVKTRIDIGLLQGDHQEFAKFDKFITSLTSAGEPNHETKQRLDLVATLCKQLSGFQNPAEVNLRETACRLLQILTKVQDSAQQHLVQVIFHALQVVLLEQGHYLVYNKLVKEMLNFASVASLQPQLLNLIWHYQLLNTSSSLLQLKKLTQVIPMCKETETVCRQGAVVRSQMPVSLLKARAYLALNNVNQMQSALNIDDTGIERDFLQALALYASQDYKQYYLTCLGLVAGAKTAEASSWHLAYAYYLKAFAEMTFLVAKRSGLKLKDDFTAADGNYDEQFFTTKASTSLRKCLTNLEAVGESQGLLSMAVHQMIKQI